MNILEQKIWKVLEDVYDPEIPTISIVDLGIVVEVKAEDEQHASVVLTPTFSGCPALHMMEDAVREKLIETGFSSPVVSHTFNVTWTTERITDKGREALLKHGLAPPPKEGYVELDVLSDIACPYCKSRNTTMQTPFGPTLCRSMHYCKNCLNAFEAFKPVT